MAQDVFLASDALEEGFLVAGRYRVVSQLGAGGMGTVYLAVDLNDESQPTALKVLHKEFAKSKTYVQRFLREAELMNRVHHPNVVETYDVGTDGGLIYFTMEYIEGKSLEAVIDEGSFPRDAIAEFIVQVCNGLGAIHEKEIIHRDLKPGNILLAADGSVRITDFGVARPKASSITLRDQKVGSVWYMAPEIWMGRKIGPSVDFYSLGILLYELVTGELPFNDDAASILMDKHLKRGVTPPVELDPDIEPWLNKLILRLLEKSPRDRPKSADEIIEYIIKRRVGPQVFERDGTPSSSTMQTFSQSRNRRIVAEKNTYVFRLSATGIMDEASSSAASPKRRRKATVVLPLPRRAALVLEIESPSRDFLYLGLFFASLQIVDGVLTSIGISRFGIVREGNPLLRALMVHFTPEQTLLLAKAAAIAVVAVLTVMAKHMKWVKDLIGLLSCIYLFAAILPWIYLLYFKHKIGG